MSSDMQGLDAKLERTRRNILKMGAIAGSAVVASLGLSEEREWPVKEAKEGRGVKEARRVKEARGVREAGEASIAS